MPIYDIFATKESEQAAETQNTVLSTGNDRFFSSLTARILFFLLLIGDFCWGAYSLSMILLVAPFHLLTGRKLFNHLLKKKWISLKRSGICGVSLFIALFSPALGIMIACTYFMMYDKQGIQDVVPRSLQDQFQEFMK